MSWATYFRDDIKALTLEPRYLLRSVAVDGWKPYGGTLAYSSFVLPGYIPSLSPEVSSVSYGDLHPGEWSATVGELTIGITGSDPRPYTTRGALVELMVGFPGYTESSFQRVFLGHVQAIRHVGETTWAITIREAVAGLTSRWTETDGENNIFHALPASTSRPTLTAGYTAGSATLTVSSTTGSNAETGGLFLVAVVSDAGDTFYLTATGKSPTSYTGVSATGVLGTTAADAAIGQECYPLAYVADHPLQVAAKVIASTGAGTNGPYDTLPASWGLGVPSYLLDEADIDENTTISSPSSGSTDWQVYSDAAVADVLGWLQGVLQPGGFFLCTRQGQITARAATIPTGRAAYVQTIYDSDIVSLSPYEAYSSRHPVEWNRIKLTAYNGSLTTAADGIDTRPARNTYEIAIPYVDGTTGWEQSIADRVEPYSTQIPESVEIVTLGWGAAQLALGDHLIVYSDLLLGRERLTEGGPFTGAHMIVTRVEPDWFGCTTRLQCVYVAPQ